VEEASAGQVDNLQCLKRVGSVNPPFLEAAVQLEFLINGWCAAQADLICSGSHRRQWPTTRHLFTSFGAGIFTPFVLSPFRAATIARSLAGLCSTPGFITRA
jgi:hypothetical protein